jgi:hypothetical protein
MTSQTQTPGPPKEDIAVKVLRVERVRSPEEEQALWYTIRLVLRDNENKTYRVWSKCVQTNPDSPVSCGKVAVPRVGKTYVMTYYFPVPSVSFADDKKGKTFYEVESEEVSDCK